MRHPVRSACAITGLILVITVGFRINRTWALRATWEHERAANEIAALPPTPATITELYDTPPSPGRRVILAGAVHVRDTIRTERPISTSTGEILAREGLVFLEDSLSGKRIVVLRSLDTPGPEWVELTPLPHNVLEPTTNHRATPLAHLAHFWLAGWADVNGPGGFVWLGLDSTILRKRDIMNPTAPPYKLAPTIRCGSVGIAPEPKVWDVVNIVIATLAGACIAACWALSVFPKR